MDSGEKPLDDPLVALLNKKLKLSSAEPTPIPVPACELPADTVVAVPLAVHTDDLPPLTPDDIALLKKEKLDELAAEPPAEPTTETVEAVPATPAEPPRQVTSDDAPAIVGIIDAPDAPVVLDTPEPDEPPPPPVDFSKSMVIQLQELEKHDGGVPPAEVAPPEVALPPEPPMLPAIPAPQPVPKLPTPVPFVVVNPEVGVPPVKIAFLPTAPKPAVAVPLPKPGFFLKGPVALKEEKEQRERRILKDAIERPIEELEANQQRINNSCLALLRDARKGNDAFRTHFFGAIGRVKLFSWGIIVLLFLAIGFVGLLHGAVKQLNGRIESLQSELGEVRKHLPPAWEMDCRLADVDKDWARGCVPRATTQSNP